MFRSLGFDECLIMAKCLICDKDFDRISRARYCSDDCRSIAKSVQVQESRKKRNERISKERSGKIKICACCGISYFRGDGGTKYCSDACLKKTRSSKGNSRRRAQKAGVDYFRTSDFPVIYSRDGGACSCCGVDTPMILRGTHDDCAPELDHIIPISRGGHHADYNLQILCRKCNIKKGNKIYAKDFDKAKLLWPTVPVVSSKNSRPTSRNKSGTKGVFFDKASGDWIAQHEVDGKRTRIRYKTEAEAIASREKMEGKNASKKKTYFPADIEWQLRRFA